MIDTLAPGGIEIVEYDRKNLPLYAALLEADQAGCGWCEAATNLMHLDLANANAEACWRSHLERARWIVGDGMGAAILAFGERPPSNRG